MQAQYATQSAILEAQSVEEKTLLGREHLVAPATLVREMVLKGEFLPADEIEATRLAWNAKPGTINHPVDEDGNFVPASSPDQLEAHSVGQLFNINASTGQLKGEVWIDKERSSQVAEELDATDPVEMLLDGETVEGSVGYYYERFAADGKHDGQEFDAVQVNIQPDHYALLPDSKGECSIDDGCGIGRNEVSALRSPVRALYNSAEKFGIKTPAFGVNECKCNMVDIERLVEETAFDRETLEAWDEDQLEALDESISQSDDNDGTDDSGTDNHDGEELAEQVANSVMEQVNSRLEEFEKQQEAEEREELTAQIVRHSDMSAEELEEWSTNQLSTLADQVTPKGGVYVGSTGSGEESSGDDFSFGLNGRHLEEAD